MELCSGKTSIIYLDTDVLGFNGIEYVDGMFWLVARNSDTLLKWNEVTEDICKIVIRDKGGKGYLGFYEPLVYKKKILLAPIMSNHFYYYNIESEAIEIIADLEYVFDIISIEEYVCGDVVLAPCLQNSKFCFVSGKDFKWHIWDVDSGVEVVYEIFADAEMERHIENLPYSNLWNKYKNIDNLMMERKNFTCEEFVRYVECINER